MRWLALALLFMLAVATPALADDVGKKHEIDSKISSIQDKLAQQKRQEKSLRGAVADYTVRIRPLEAKVGDVSLHLQPLEAPLSLHQKRLAALNNLSHFQSALLNPPRGEYRHSVSVLN